MKKLAVILLIWASTLFGAYYTYNPHGQFNWNNVGTVPDSTWLIDWTIPDTFYTASVTNLGSGSVAVSTTLANRGWHNLTWVFWYQSTAVKLRDDFQYEVKDTLEYLGPTQVANITGNLSGSIGSVAANGITASSIATDAIGAAEIAAGAITSAEATSIGTIGNTQTFNNTGTWAGNITGSVSGSVGSVTGSVGSVTGAVGSVTGNVGGSVASVTGNVGGNVVGSVASVTGNIGGNVTGSVGNVLALANNVITSASINNGAFAKAEFATDFLHEIALRSDSGVTIMLTDADIDSIVARVVAGGIAIDTAAFRANLQATPMVIGTNNDKTNYALAAGAINSAAFAASGAHVIAQASDSGGLVLVDYNIIASTAYDYFTAGNREDVFKGGAGAGPDTTLIYVLSALDSTPIVGASVSYFVGASKLATATDSLGLAVFGATPGTYTAIAEAKPRYASTVSVTAGSVATIYMTQPTIPAPSDTALTGVYGYVYNLSGSPVAGAIVVARNQGRDIQIGNLIVSQYEVSDTTDAAGFWSLPLYPTATLGGSAYKYTFSLFRGSQQVIRKPDITVPNQASWQFDW